MRRPKHLPQDQIPEADLKAFRVAYESRDVFDEIGGLGAHLAPGSRKMILTTYRRWLGFLERDELTATPADRITRERVRAYIDHLSDEMRTASVAINLHGLHHAARLMDSARDWAWLKSIAVRLNAGANPKDRFNQLMPGWSTLDYGIGLMDAALALPAARGKVREIQYRDGLLLALLSLWPIRRRSVAALTISRHLEFDQGGVNILLHPQDTKSKRPESCRLHEQLVPYLKGYLSEIRPLFLGSDEHDGLWASCKACPLGPDALYCIVRKHTARGFGKPMGLHDFRRAAATFLATEAPELVGLIPGVLQHSSPDVGEQYYNLAKSIGASRRHVATVRRMREELRLFVRKQDWRGLR